MRHRLAEALCARRPWSSCSRCCRRMAGSWARSHLAGRGWETSLGRGDTSPSPSRPTSAISQASETQTVDKVAGDGLVHAEGLARAPGRLRRTGAGCRSRRHVPSRRLPGRGPPAPRGAGRASLPEHRATPASPTHDRSSRGLAARAPPHHGAGGRRRRRRHRHPRPPASERRPTSADPFGHCPPPPRTVHRPTPPAPPGFRRATARRRPWTRGVAALHRVRPTHRSRTGAPRRRVGKEHDVVGPCVGGGARARPFGRTCPAGDGAWNST